MFNWFSSLFLIESIQNLLVKIVISAGLFCAFYFASNLFNKYSPNIFKFIFHIKKENIQKAFVHSFTNPIVYFIRFLGLWCAINYIPFNNSISFFIISFMNKAFKVLLIVFVSISAKNFVSNVPVIFDNIQSKFGGLNTTIIRFFSNLAKSLIIIFTFVIILNEFGYDVSGVITGLGLSGLTFALAAQDTASNFFSGLVILTDKPFEIGDWISVGSMEGIVEEMNFRSCRIRTFDNALIAVPNNKLSSDSVTNWTKMNMRKTNIVIGLVYTTSKETLQSICSDIKSNIEKMDGIKTDSVLVRFDKFSSSSLDIKISYNSYLIPLSEHTALKEKVQFMIMDVVSKYDTDFAFNSMTIYNGQ